MYLYSVCVAGISHHTLISSHLPAKLFKIKYLDAFMKWILKHLPCFLEIQGTAVGKEYVQCWLQSLEVSYYNST